MPNTSRSYVQTALGIPIRSLASCPNCIDPGSGAVFWGYVLGVVGPVALPKIGPQDPLALQLLSDGYSYQLTFKLPNRALLLVLSVSASAPVDPVCVGRTLSGLTTAVSTSQSVGTSCLISPLF